MRDLAIRMRGIFFLFLISFAFWSIVDLGCGLGFWGECYLKEIKFTPAVNPDHSGISPG